MCLSWSMGDGDDKYWSNHDFVWTKVQISVKSIICKGVGESYQHNITFWKKKKNVEEKAASN